MPRPVLLRKPKVLSSDHVQIMNPVRLHNFILDYGEEEQRSVRSFWQSYANRKKLITFGIDTGTGRYPRYGYDIGRQMYYYMNPSGRKVPVSNTSIKLDV